MDDQLEEIGTDQIRIVFWAASSSISSARRTMRLHFHGGTSSFIAWMCLGWRFPFGHITFFSLIEESAEKDVHGKQSQICTYRSLRVQKLSDCFEWWKYWASGCYRGIPKPESTRRASSTLSSKFEACSCYCLRTREPTGMLESYKESIFFKISYSLSHFYIILRIIEIFES